ncbi:MAG: DUF4118 domain-containing protein [Bacteroidales bacterium]|jgi:two-component system sensor histidine kinase KdpD|nr:DUF4118 domain-containing protein [Bacteroidales bacterium]
MILVSLICYQLKELIGYRQVSFILLFVVTLLAIFFSTGPILLASVLGAVIWDFFFIPPSFTLHIGDTEDTLMLVMFFIVALVNGILTSRVKRQERNARNREEKTLALYKLTRELLEATEITDIVIVAQQFLKKYFNVNPALLLWDEDGTMNIHYPDNDEQFLSEADKRVAMWVFKNSMKAGRDTEEYSSSARTFYPLQSSLKCLGVIGMRLKEALTPAEEQFLEACVTLVAGKFERELLSAKAKDAYILAESDKLYKTLFNSISHELRIPVATIMGATDTLLSEKYPEQTRKRLYSEMGKASVRLNRLIENLLNMSRLESGHLSSRPDWCDVHDLINKVVGTLGMELSPFILILEIPEDMPLVYIDFGLMEQVLHNLLLNATQYAPEGTEIVVSFAYEKRGSLIVRVTDHGKGFSPADLNLLFRKFYRGEKASSGGTGLGLSIVKGFVEAHGGSVSASNRDGGGAVFTIEIPVNASEINEYKQI